MKIGFNFAMYYLYKSKNDVFTILYFIRYYWFGQLRY